MFQTITKSNVWNIVGVGRQVSTVDFCKQGVTRRVPSGGVVGSAGKQAVVSSLPAANEMDNLQAITFRQISFCPLIAGYNAAVQFDGDTICFHPQLIEKGREGKRRIEIASFAIDLQFHIRWDLRSTKTLTASEASSCSTGGASRPTAT